MFEVDLEELKVRLKEREEIFEIERAPKINDYIKNQVAIDRRAWRVLDCEVLRVYTILLSLCEDKDYCHIEYGQLPIIARLDEEVTETIVEHLKKIGLLETVEYRELYTEKYIPYGMGIVKEIIV